ncbi:tetratricopeptide repeat protein [bacterium SCSIO 12741]|nr:tetratricopeptide repeat protein [bacterium SCSIO 12741]
MTQADQYYLQAKEDYPYNLEESLENLERALRMEEGHPGALYLMGRLRYEQLQDSQGAEDYYRRALQENPDYWLVGYHLARLLIRQGRFHQGEQWVSKTLSHPESRKDWLYQLRALINEKKRAYDQALHWLREAQLETTDSDYLESLQSDAERIQEKMLLVKKVKYVCV